MYKTTKIDKQIPETMSISRAIFTTIVAILVLAAGESTSGFRIFFRGRVRGGNIGAPATTAPDNTTVPDHYFDQKLNHFDTNDSRTWKQRYFVNDSFFDRRPKRPVFLMIGGEGEASRSWMLTGAWIDYARDYNALCFMLEHRFYGKSRPTNDTSVENLKYLSSDQALEDLAAFIRAMNIKYQLNRGYKWIVFGGSYPGTLAVWMRKMYPSLVYGAVSSSGPLLAKFNFKKYYAVVEQALVHSSQQCLDNVQKGTQELREKLDTVAGQTEINQLFRLCDNIGACVSDVNDIANFYETLAGNFAGVVQYNGDNRQSVNAAVRNLTVDVLCKQMLDESIGEPYKRLAAVNRLVMSAYNQTCFEFKYRKMIEASRNRTWDSEVAEGGRQWTYQTCTEFGFFQTSDQKPNVFGNQFPVDFYTKQCADIFGPRFDHDFVKRAVHKTNHKHAGLKINVTNVIFVHGSLDPWHVLGITRLEPSPAPGFASNLAILIKNAAHCANMYPSSDTDSLQLRHARSLISGRLKRWLSGTKRYKKSYYFAY